MKYKWRTRPYAHQVQAVKKLLRNGFGGALLMEPRTGKTKTTIDYLSILATQGKIDRALIIAPQRVLGVWIDEFLRHSPLRVHVTVWDAKARKRGAPPQPDRAHGYDLWVVVTNFDAFATPGRRLASGRRSKATGRFHTRSQIKKWIGGQPAACVVDESHKIKSASGKASTLIVSMRTWFSYRLILTGTPVTKAKRVHDLYMQWQFLNPERFADLPTVQSFKKYTGKWIDSNGYPQWVRANPKALADVQRRIHMDAFAITRDQCFDLPPRDAEIVRVPLTASARVYDAMAAQMVAELDSGSITEASIALVKMLRLAQIAGGFTKTTEGVIERIGMEKLSVLRDLLEEYIERDEKVVLCATFKEDLDMIASMCRDVGFHTYELRGGVSRADGDLAVKRFRENNDASAFVMQPGAGALGIDLSTSARMVWFNLPSSWVNYTQSCDRIALSRKSTTFTYLLAENTVDELMYDVLQTDGEIGKAILQSPESLRRSPS